MSAAPPSAARTLVVMLGGSTYPRNPSFDNPRFQRAAAALREYFEDPARFGLPASQLLWLFDSPGSPNELNDRIDAFLGEAMRKPDDERPQDVIVCFIGHGFFDDDKHYRLAVPSFKPGEPEYSYEFRFLLRTVKKHTRRARKFFVLDACYSAAAAGEMMAQSAEPVMHRIVSEVEAESAPDLPQSGTALLCAASKDDQAFAPEAEDCTMFTGALLSVLQQPSVPADALSLHQLHSLIDEHIEKRYGDRAVHPEIHVPDQKQGDVGAIPIFTLRRVAPDQTSSGIYDALDEATFADERLLHAVVVCRRGHVGEGALPDLIEVLDDAWHNFHTKIAAAADLCRAAWRAPPVPPGLEEAGLVLAHLAVERAFESEDSLRRAVAALCRAEIAIFDLTDWDPGPAFLLGVRAVVRRGVTITSVASIGGKEFKIGGSFSVPFNLQLLNLAAHSKEQAKQGAGKRPHELLGEKIANGFKELASLPHYLDLPAYDSIRQLGIESDAYRAVPMRERILVLCPFSEGYQPHWERLERRLPGCVASHISKTEGLSDPPAPALARLLDLRTPRLVAQTLFESIRLVDMCIIDWTDKRANVIFEAGVRMAAHPLGAVHVIEEGAFKRLRRDDAADAQVLALLGLLAPVPYPLAGRANDKFDRMVQRFAASEAANSRGETQFIYAAAGAALDRRSQPAALPLFTELLRSANILQPDDQESTGVSAVLYLEVNRGLVTEASEAAADRRLAAWLFLVHRYTADEIAADAQRLVQFELLSFQVKRWARRAKREDLLEEIGTVTEAVSRRRGQQGPTTYNEEVEAAQLVARAKLDKEVAKDLRDERKFDAAAKLLEGTVQALADSGLGQRIEAALKAGAQQAGKPMRDVAAQFADCLGMLGGNHRRLDRHDRAQECFDRGSRVEASPALEVMSSYNLVNAITLPVLSDAQSLVTRRAEIERAVGAIEKQVRGGRRNDRWAWADLAQCQLLLDRMPGALQSYGRVRDLGDDDALTSVITMLDKLREAAPDLLADRVAAAIERLRR